MVVAPYVMQFPYHEGVQNATHKKRQRKTTRVQKGKDLVLASTTSNSVSNMSETGSNNPIQEQTVLLLPCPEEEAPTTHTDPLENVVPQSLPRKKIRMKKKLTPKRSFHRQPTHLAPLPIPGARSCN